MERVDSLGDVLAIDLEVTSACNAVCGFCPREVMPDRYLYVSMDVVKRLATELAQYQSPRKTVVLCGIGESTMHPQLTSIVQTISSAGARVDMTTNGELMAPAMFTRLAEAGLASMNFSINAATSQTHSRVMKLKHFPRIVDNVLNIVELKKRAFPEMDLNVSFVVCNLNSHEVSEFVEFWRSTGITRIWLHPVNNRAGFVSEAVRNVDIGTLARRYEDDDLVIVDIFGNVSSDERICKIAKSLIFLSADGEMRLCAMDYERKTSYGNLLKDSLPDMHADKLRRFAQGETRDLCIDCDFCPAGIH